MKLPCIALFSVLLVNGVKVNVQSSTKPPKGDDSFCPEGYKNAYGSWDLPETIEMVETTPTTTQVNVLYTTGDFASVSASQPALKSDNDIYSGEANQVSKACWADATAAGHVTIKYKYVVGKGCDGDANGPTFKILVADQVVADTVQGPFTDHPYNSCGGNGCPTCYSPEKTMTFPVSGAGKICTEFTNNARNMHLKVTKISEATTSDQLQGITSSNQDMNVGDQIFDVLKLRAALMKEPAWKHGHTWILRAKFTSDSPISRIFTFMPGKFLTIKVPAGAYEQVLQVGSPVATVNQEQVGFQYDGSDKPAGNQWTWGKITMTDICFAPKACNLFPERQCPPGSVWQQDVVGDSRDECCRYTKCKEVSDACSPSTQWTKMDTFETKLGYNNDTCCLPIECPKDFCANETQWKSKDSDSSYLGSTNEECCETLDCSSYECSHGLHWTKKSVTLADGSPRLGSTDAECCTPVYCIAYDCGDPEYWVHKADAANTQVDGNKKTCCDELMCDVFACPNNTQWKPNPDAKAGNSKEACCTPLFCNTWECSNNSLEKLPLPHQRPGNSDAECCTRKKCMNWKCSNPTLWIKRTDQRAQTGTDREGWSDEECCDPLFCQTQACSPATQWTPKPDTSTIQGTTAQQCCDPVYCDGYVCDTDINRTGKGTQWYKKEDTNNYRWQGMTNAECCVPIYCSQYTTAHPTKWKRKADASKQGSTDRECYDKLLCEDHCCKKPLILRPKPEEHQGSTDEECCVEPDDTVGIR
eukprot:TRINITY_DN36313_c0_g1_i1.p1 TRINITY_DN36313_c0_g1~~TRINITY_DN36313_c0_g1_i1.p1  ORF type:complete len:757 (+),score=115.14 TRINITY_DN36313_c0_g1_i1:105-2375(+)